MQEQVKVKIPVGAGSFVSNSEEADVIGPSTCGSII